MKVKLAIPLLFPCRSTHGVTVVDDNVSSVCWAGGEVEDAVISMSSFISADASWLVDNSSATTYIYFCNNYYEC